MAPLLTAAAVWAVALAAGGCGGSDEMTTSEPDAIGTHVPGEEITVKVERASRTLEVAVTLTER